MKNWRKNLRRFWLFVWEDDSFLSWIVNIALAFVLIKFIVYPGLGLLFQTSYPVVAVVSGSMEHDKSFDDWWQSRAACDKPDCRQADWYAQAGITKDEFKTFIFKNGFNTGDIIVLFGSRPENIEIGDVIVYGSNKPYPIIHRVVGIRKTDSGHVFETKGDHNPTQGADDIAITEDRIFGKAAFRIPLLGWIKIWFFNIIYYAADFMGLR